MIRWLEDHYIRAWLITVGWSAGVALVIYVVGALGSSAASRAASRASASAVAVALGFVAGHLKVAGIPDFPPERWQWSVWLTVASLLLLFTEDAKGGQSVLRFVLLLLLVVALDWYVLRPSSLAREWTRREEWIGYFGGGLAAVCFLVLAEYVAIKAPPWRAGVAATIASAAAAAVFIVTHASDKVARTEAGLAAALGTCTLLSLVQRDVPLGRTVVTTSTIAFGSLLLYVWSVLSDDRSVDDVTALLLFASWASVLIPLPHKHGWTTLVLSVLLAALPAGFAYYRVS